MAKQLLTGSLEEQCEFLYQLAQEKMKAGNYTGAAHALKEILKYAPDYRDAANLLEQAKRRKAEQRRNLLVSLAGAVVFIGIAVVLDVSNDFWKLAFAFVGLLVGFAVANLISSYRRSSTS
jgi:hypothetical protein